MCSVSCHGGPQQHAAPQKPTAGPHHVHQLLDLRRVRLLRVRHRRRHAGHAAGVEHPHQARQVRDAAGWRAGPRLRGAGGGQSAEEVARAGTLQLLYGLRSTQLESDA